MRVRHDGRWLCAVSRLGRSVHQKVEWRRRVRRGDEGVILLFFPHEQAVSNMDRAGTRLSTARVGRVQDETNCLGEEEQTGEQSRDGRDRQDHI